VNSAFTRRARITEIMMTLGFREENRYFRHPDTEFVVEFPPGPLGIGKERVQQIDEIETATGVVKIISPTDCVKDRLAWYYHDNDTECLEQAVLVARSKVIDLAEVARWSAAEGKGETFTRIKNRLLR